LTSEHVHCGVCGQRRLWLLTGYWWDYNGHRAVVLPGHGMRAEGYPDDHAQLRIVAKKGWLYLPLCTSRCAGEMQRLLGGFARKNEAKDVRFRDRVKAALPVWWRDAGAEEATEAVA